MRRSLSIGFVIAATVGFILGGAGAATASTGTEDALVPRCLQEATEQTLEDPVGTLIADVEAVLEDPGGFLAAEVECVGSILH